MSNNPTDTFIKGNGFTAHPPGHICEAIFAPTYKARKVVYRDWEDILFFLIRYDEGWCVVHGESFLKLSPPCTSPEASMREGMDRLNNLGRTTFQSMFMGKAVSQTKSRIFINMNLTPIQGVMHEAGVTSHGNNEDEAEVSGEESETDEGVERPRKRRKKKKKKSREDHPPKARKKKRRRYIEDDEE